MREKMEQRQKELKAEFESGQKMLVDLEARQTSIRETLLRISGAIQVLEETLAQGAGENGSSRELAETGMAERA
jgi:hypothetical protein